jgi:hypothetical protein
MNFRSVMPQIALIMTSCSLAFSQDITEQSAWRIVSIGDTELPSDWEENRFSLQKDGTVKGPFTESAEFHGFQKNGVSTNAFDGGKIKVTTKITDAASICRYKRDKDGVKVSVIYSWSVGTSYPGGELKTKLASRTVLHLPEKVILDPPKKLTGRIEQIMTYEAPAVAGQAGKMEMNVTGMLEMRLKDEQPTPESFETLQAIKSLPIVIEQLPRDGSE